MQEEPACRIDTWLWAVRLFKSRSRAAEAIKAGRVRIGGQPVKASRHVHQGEEITIRKGVVQLQFRVLGILHRRVSAPLAKTCCDDITPEEEKQKLLAPDLLPPAFRPRGSGRPTKKERRALDDFNDYGL